LRASESDRETSLILSLPDNVWRCLVESDTETLQFIFDNFLVVEGLEDVENDENDVASSRDGNDGLTTTLTVLSSFNNTWKILS
jgi:hypothetical protein